MQFSKAITAKPIDFANPIDIRLPAHQRAHRVHETGRLALRSARAEASAASALSSQNATTLAA